MTRPTEPYKAILLSAGQGSRLLPMTENLPKCLLDLAGRTMLEWQLRALAEAGVGEAVVVTGFRTDLVEQALEQVAPSRMRVRVRFNPFYKVADNLASCWMVRDELLGPASLILNGDTLFEPEIARRLLGAPPAPIVVTIDRKPAYDDDDMKVTTVGDRLSAIGKKLAGPEANGESIGFVRFDSKGSAAFVAELERTLRTPEGTGLWYLSAIQGLSKGGTDVRVATIEGLKWAELDFPADLQRCRELAASWSAGEAQAKPATKQVAR